MVGVEILDRPWRVSWKIHVFFIIFFCGVVTYHPSIQRRVIAQCEQLFETESKARLTSRGAVFHALLGSVVFKDVAVQRQGAPRPLLTAKHTSVSFAPVQSLLCKRFIFESSIVGMCVPMDRGMSGVLDVVDFFKALLATSSDYVSLRGLTFSDVVLGDMNVQASVAVPSQFAVPLSGHSLTPGLNQFERVDGGGWNIAVSEGDLKFPTVRNSPTPVRMGKLAFKIPSAEGARTVVGELFGRGEKSYFVFREGEFTKAMFEHTDRQLKYRFVAPADDLVACAHSLFPEKKVRERYAPYRSFAQAQDLLIKCSGELDLVHDTGRMSVASSHYRSQAETALAGSITHDKSRVVWRGGIVVNKQCELQSDVTLDVVKKAFQLAVYNKKAVAVPGGNYVIPGGKMRCSLKTTSFDTVVGRYEIMAGNPENSVKNMVASKGLFSLHDDQVSLAGNLNKHTVYALASCAQGVRMRRLLIVDDKKNVDVHVKSVGAHDERCEGTISQQCVYRCIPSALRAWLTGDVGKISFVLDQREMPTRCIGDVNLVDSACCLVGSSNPLLSARMRFDVDAVLKAATLSDIDLILSSGIVTSKEILLNWSAEGISFFHFPLKVSNVFVNKERDFGAVVDGSCSVDWIDGGKYRVDGSFVIKKSQLSSLEFMSNAPVTDEGTVIPFVETQKKDGDLGIDGNILLKTQEPTIVSLPTLRTKVHADVRIGGYFRSDGRIFPKVAGSLRLDGGVLEVLGRPLRIMKGSVDMLSSQTDNPLIDFFAYTNVKQYRITIHGSGSLQQTNIIFESNPPLSQEQIIGLLLSGSEHADINQQLPGIFLQNIHKMLNPADQSGQGRSVWQPLLNSLRYVQLLPYQDDLSSQKTVKARLNIDLGPHVRALLHKDIFGKEAVAMLVEYDVSEDLNVRLMRQSSGTLGAEAEIRFKF